MTVRLGKRQIIKLEKENGAKLKNICVGINWGSIERKGLLCCKRTEYVDLDASCATFSRQNKTLELIYFGNLKSKNGSIRHSGDDSTGNMNENNEPDNEVITVDLEKLPEEVAKIAFVLNSFRGYDFKLIPFASIRIYEGCSTQDNEIFATYDAVNDATFAGSVSMIMGILYKHNDGWKFYAVGEAARENNLQDILLTVISKYL
ncbi:MAG: TerD family protein [Prevotellaceae bacterium]|jgi:tellurium resistance protein TerZ|nr:TerD family protein [Prevotellaceae bacterium]